MKRLLDDKLRNILGAGYRKYAENTIWLVLEQCASLALAMVAGIWVARYLGPERFGSLGFAQSIVGLLAVLANFGLDSIVVRDIVASPPNRGRILGSAMVLRAIGSCAVMLLLAVLVFTVGELQDVHSLVLLIGAGSFGSILATLKLSFQADVRARAISSALIGQAGVFAAARIAGAMQEAPLWYFALVAGLDPCVAGVVTWAYFRRDYSKTVFLRRSSDIALKLVKESWPLLLSSLAIAFYMKIDQVMLKSMAGAAENGFYLGAVRLSEPWAFVAVLLCQSLFPAIIAARQGDRLAYEKRLQRLFDLLWVLSLAIAIPITFFAPFIVETLFGPTFSDSIAVLRVHIWSCVAVFLGVGTAQWLVAEGYQRLDLARTLVGLAFNVILNFLLIPKYGALGASWATTVSYIISVFGALLFHKPSRGIIRLVWRSITFASFFHAQKPLP